MPLSPQTQTVDNDTTKDGVLALGIGARVALLAGVVGLATAGAVMLRSGPESDHAAVPVTSESAAVTQPRISGTPEHIAPDAPVFQLGVGEDGDWRLGQQTRYVMAASSKVLPEITIQAESIEPGRYEAPGHDLVIEGDLTQDYVEFTAANITVTGNVNTDNVRLIADDREPTRKNVQYWEMARSTYFSIKEWMHEYERGDVTIGGSVTGDNIDILAGEITIDGSAIGRINLAASGGEDTYVEVTAAHGLTMHNFSDWRTMEIDPVNFRESVRYGRQQPEEVIHVAGETSADVTLMRAPDWLQARAAAIAPQEPVAPGTPAPLNADLPEGTAVDGRRRQPIP